MSFKRLFSNILFYFVCFSLGFWISMAAKSAVPAVVEEWDVIEQAEYDLLHPQERYGACWEYCKEDVKQAHIFIFRLLDVAEAQQRQQAQLKDYIKNQTEYIERLQKELQK